MSSNPAMVRDERTIAVENASYRWGFTFLLFALLIDVMYRGFFRNEAAWELMGLVIVSSGLSTIYQARHRIWGRGWLWSLTIASLVAAVVAAATAIVLNLTGTR